LTTETVSTDKGRAEDRDRELERVIRHALALAAGRRVANRALRRARLHARRHAGRKLIAAAAHGAAYATLLGYIWHRERARKHPAAA
jgi:hypothetical protein